MDKTLFSHRDEKISAAAAWSEGVPGWLLWTPYAAVAWSLLYAALGFYWLLSGKGFPYDLEPGAAGSLSVVGMQGVDTSWKVVLTLGLPAAMIGVAMARGARTGRFFFVAAGTLIAGILLLLMADINLLTLIGYIPMGLVKLLSGAEFGQAYLQSWAQWPVLHQMLCLVGGFLWLGATLSYARRSGDACLVCGRRDEEGGWTSPSSARRWGRIAVWVAMIAPLVYAVTRYAWALGIPLGISEEHLRSGQADGIWISGLFLANFGLVGALLMLGLVQRWGEVFPSWMPGLAGRRVPIGLAVVPASLASVLLTVGGISISSAFSEMADNAAALGQNVWVVVGPTLLFPLWGAALAVATLAYYFRRRGPCSVCGRGA